MLFLLVFHHAGFSGELPPAEITIKSSSFMSEHVLLISELHRETFSAQVTKEPVVSPVMNHVTI